MGNPAVGVCLSVLGLLGIVAICASAANTTTTPEPVTATSGSSQGTDAQQLAAFWARAQQETYKSAAELSAQHAREVRKGLSYSKLMHGDRRLRTIALTFDDGPHPQFTPQLLAILKRYDVKATFFLVGEMALKSPDLVRAEVSDGHVIGNHTLHHVNLTKIPLAGVLTEWQANQDVVKSITGQTMRYCRPPGGDYDDAVIRAAMDLGLITVLWTDDPGDYASPGDAKIEKRVLDRIDNGGIILIHDGIQQTIDVLPQIIEHLKGKGFRFVTVAEMEAQTGRK